MLVCDIHNIWLEKLEWVSRRTYTHQIALSTMHPQDFITNFSQNSQQEQLKRFLQRNWTGGDTTIWAEANSRRKMALPFLFSPRWVCQPHVESKGKDKPPLRSCRVNVLQSSRGYLKYGSVSTIADGKPHFTGAAYLAMLPQESSTLNAWYNTIFFFNYFHFKFKMLYY